MMITKDKLIQIALIALSDIQAPTLAEAADVVQRVGDAFGNAGATWRTAILKEVCERRRIPFI